MKVDGGQLIQAALAFEKPDMLKFYISKGANVQLPPDTVSKLYIDHERKPEYRKSPFIIQAAAQGSLECYDILIQSGCKASEIGFIGFSRKRKNQVISNVTGAAAFNGSNKILKQILKKPALANINYLSTEKKDFNAVGVFNKEYTGYTPIMLATAGGGQNLDCIKQLLNAKADLTVLDEVGNNVLHIAAYHQNCLALEYILGNWPSTQPLDLALRNKKGETVFSIANDLKDQKSLGVLKQFEGKFGDQTEQTTRDLLEELMQEEKKQELEKQKRKEKKKRQKLQHIAEKEGLSIQELEEKHAKENEAKRLEEEERKLEEEERLKRETEAAAEEQRRREARERALYNLESSEVNPLNTANTQRNARNTAQGPTTRSKSVKFA